MKIGIIGAGAIGATLTQRLSAAGHDVVVANSRGPETIAPELLTDGARAVHAHEVVTPATDAVIISVPLNRLADVAPLLADLREDAVVLDTSNYYPARDGHITALDDGQVESQWASQQLGRPVVKAWNAITTGSFNTKATTAGTPDRVAIPVAADSETDRALGMALVEETGFAGHDAGVLAESWRQQPGTPAYCTDLTGPQLTDALAAADPARSPKRRDLAMHVIAELMKDPSGDRGGDFLVRVNRLIYN